jgi:hypothetical protein
MLVAWRIPQEVRQGAEREFHRFAARFFHRCEVKTGILPDLKSLPVVARINSRATAR